MIKRFVVVDSKKRNKPEFEHYLEIRKANNITAGFLGIEGLHSLEGNIANLQVFVDAGVRMMSPTFVLFLLPLSDCDLGSCSRSC